MYIYKAGNLGVSDDFVLFIWVTGLFSFLLSFCTCMLVCVIHVHVRVLQAIGMSVPSLHVHGESDGVVNIHTVYIFYLLFSVWYKCSDYPAHLLGNTHVQWTQHVL